MHAPRSRIAILAALALASWPLCVRAEDSAPFRTPTPPEEAPAWWEFEVDVSFIVPVERSTICPASAECVLNGGVGLGVRAFYRNPDGLSWLGAYDLLAFDSDSVYEISLLHALRFGLRYTLDGRGRVQPWIGATVGPLAFGGPNSLATGGAVVTLAAGAHVELTESLSLVLAAELWTLGTGSFRTRDGVDRAQGFGVDVLFQASLGLNARFGELVPHL
jgi:hypothetical protein